MTSDVEGGKTSSTLSRAVSHGEVELAAMESRVCGGVGGFSIDSLMARAGEAGREVCGSLDGALLSQSLEGSKGTFDI